ncbi:hypothetical protein, partial [Mycobacterium sp. E1747]|uniref:hypothetical protein n=1 Tax=Mycobacterium sp. E1747 TaxID=1834128 RepID=UPI001E2BC540
MLGLQGRGRLSSGWPPASTTASRWLGCRRPGCRAESEEIENLVASALAGGTDDPALAAAHQQYLAGKRDGDTPHDIQGAYNQASEMLSCLLEASLRT